MATVNKLGKNSWEVRWDEYDLNGKRHQRRKKFTRAGDANDFAKSLDLDRPYDACQMTVAQWLSSWFESYCVKLEASTQPNYRRILDRWAAYLGGVKLADLKPSHIDKFYAALSDPAHPLADKALSSSTIQRHHAVMHRAMEYAVRDGLIVVNPLSRVERPKSSRQPLDLPSMADVQARLDALQGTSFYLPVALALITGMRQSEVLGLRWDCVDLAGRCIAVRRVRQRLGQSQLDKLTLNAHTRLIPDMPGWIERDCTKSKHNRTIPISASLCALLKSAKAAQAAQQLRLGPQAYHVTDYVCTYSNGTPMSDSDLSHAMKGICRYHDLRHINGTQLLIAGFSPADVAGMLGHTTPTTTLNYYAHTVEDQRIKAAETIASLVDLKSNP